MVANYSPKLPQDRAGAPMQEYPAPLKAKAQYVAAPVASSVVSLTDNTTAVEIGAIGGGGILMRWVPVTETAAGAPFGSVIASGAGANYDHFIPANQYRRFVVPIDPLDTPAPQSVVGLNVQLGLYSRIAWINATATSSSVFGTEY
jgi:hypothetical protein